MERNGEQAFAVLPASQKWFLVPRRQRPPA